MRCWGASKAFRKSVPFDDLQAAFRISWVNDVTKLSWLSSVILPDSFALSSVVAFCLGSASDFAECLFASSSYARGGTRRSGTGTGRHGFERGGEGERKSRDKDTRAGRRRN